MGLLNSIGTLLCSVDEKIDTQDDPMASAFLRGSRFYAKWKDNTGVWRSKPLPGVATLAKALAEAVRLEATLADRHGEPTRNVPTCTPETSVPGAKVEAQGTFKTVAQLMAWWCDQFVSARSKQPTASRLEKHFIRDVIGSMAVSSFTHMDATRFLHRKQNDEKLSSSSVNHLRSMLRSAFKEAIEHGHFAGDNPILKTKKRKGTQTSEREWIRPEEVQPFLDAVAKTSPQWLNVIAFTLFTGLRKGEVFGLRVSDVDLNDQTIRVQRSWDSNTTKSGKIAHIPIADACMPYIRAALKRSQALNSDLVFPNDKGEMHSRFVDVADAVRRSAKAAGIKRDLDFHCLRHSCASILADKGIPMHIIQRVLRHSSIEVTNRTYSHIQSGALKDAVNRI